MKQSILPTLGNILGGQVLGLLGKQMYRDYLRLFARIGGLFLLLITLVLSLGLHYLIIDYGTSVNMLLSMIFLTIPSSLSVIIPFSAVLASITLFHRLAQHNELIAMRLIGFGPWPLVKPIALFGIFLALFGWFNALWLMPISSQTFNKINRSFRHQEVNFILKPGKFHQIGKNVMLYVRNVDDDTLYRDVLISTQKPDGSSQTLIAQSGQFNQDFNSPGFLLRHGIIQDFDAQRRSLSVIQFDTYQVRIAEQEVNKVSYWMKSSERFLPDLLFPDTTNSSDQQRYDELVTKGHDRIITPLYFFLLPILAALLMIHAEFNRRAFVGKILSCLMICFGLFILHRVSLNMAAGNLALLPIGYGLLLLTSGMVIALYCRKNPLPLDIIAAFRTLKTHRRITEEPY